MGTTTETRINSTQAKDAIFKMHNVQSSASEIDGSVNKLTDPQTTLIKVGDTAKYSSAVRASYITGMTYKKRIETENDYHRPVGWAYQYFINPTVTPSQVTDYHGMDIYGAVGDDTLATDLSNTSLYLMESKASYTGTNTLKGNYGALLEANNYSTGTILSNSALNVYSRNQGSGTINNLYGIKVYNAVNNGIVNNAYGLYLGDYRVGSGGKYAIYSEGGDVRFLGKLDVTGATTIVGATTVTGLTALVGDTTVTGKLKFPYSATNTNKIYSSNGSYYGEFIPFTKDGTTEYSNFYVGVAGGHAFKTENTIKVKIITNGNVGIGTETPTEKLEVVGKIKATSINFSGLPTSITGLTTGDVWNDGGTIKII